MKCLRVLTSNYMDTKEITQIKIDTEVMKKDISQLKVDVQKNGTDMKEEFKSLSGKIDCLDAKFSAKWVEVFLIWAGRIVGYSIIAGLIALIAKSAFHFF